MENNKRTVLVILAIFVILFLVLLRLKVSSRKPVVEKKTEFPIVSSTPYPTWEPKPSSVRPTITYGQYPFKSADVTREVEIIGCIADNSEWGMSYPKKIVSVLNVSAIAQETMKTFLKEANLNGWGSFPTSSEVQKYLVSIRKTNPSYKYEFGEVRLRNLTIDKYGAARVYFSKELEAYGGGSAKVACIQDSMELTLKQFPTIKNVILCIENTCADQKGSTILQP